MGGWGGGWGEEDRRNILHFSPLLDHFLMAMKERKANDRQCLLISCLNNHLLRITAAV